MKRRNFITLFASCFLIAGGLSFALVKEKEETPVKEVEAATYNQTVNEYYSSINWDLTGANLKTALFNKIKITTAGWSYDGLWTAYKTTDVRPDGTHFWDIYSDTTMYTLNDSRINASYKKEGDSINREHVIPQSSFNEAAPMKSDVHHVLPSDGYVNNRRSSYPHGIVSGSPTYTSNDGCKLGSGTGSSTVFEPMDQYKGDIARIYFYFVTCYQDKMSNNSFSAFDKTTYPSIKTAYLNVYLQWAKDDPVSQKEIDRNNAAYAGQGNRNPFIDCPYAVGAIWDSSHASDYGVKGQYTSGTGVSLSKTAASLTSGGQSTTISATSTDSSSISWTTSNSNIVSISNNSSSSGSSITLTSGNTTGTATITASATIGGKIYSNTCTVTVTAPKSLSSITINEPKTSYVIDSSFVKPTVTAHYSDSTSADVTEYATFSGYNLSSEGDQTVTVSYTEGNTTKTTSYSINVHVSGGTESGTFSQTYSYSDLSNWSVSNCTNPSGYILCPDTSNTTSVALFSGIFSDKTITSDVVITINNATYGNGTTPSATTFKMYNSSACTNQVTASQSGSLPTSSSYVDTIYTVSQANASSGFTDDLAILITKPGRQVRLKSVKVEFDYETESEPVTPKTLESISVKTAPSTISYDVGDTFDPTGLVITLSYSDSSTEDVSYSGHESSFSFDPSPVTPLTALDTYVTIYYGGFDCDQSITVTAAKTLSSISISGYTTSFVEGDDFSFGGTVTANFSDSSSDNVTSSATFSGYNMTSTGNQTVTVSYTYKGVNKTQNYNISVEKGILSSISVSGQTTVYQKGNAFAFDGTCTATFANGYEKEVAPTSVTSPDMTTSGNKTITVSFTYNGNTRTTTYDITVNSDRVVIETTTTTGYSVIGTVTYPSNTQTISVNTISVSTSGYTAIESNAIRLGSGSNTGTVTVTSTTSNITRVVVNAKTYGSDTGVTLTVGGTSNTITSSYADYVKEYTTATNSVAIATTASKKRAYIESITIYETKTTTIETDISTSSDCVGLETFITKYMHMDYVQNLGYCKDSEHHYYSTAKSAFNSLNEHQRILFTSNIAYTSEWNRLQAWASFNGESLNSSNQLAARIVPLTISTEKDSTVFVVLIFASMSAISVIGLLIIKRRKNKK